MLHEFLVANRAELIDRCRVKVARRPLHPATAAELEHGIPQFLDQLIETLRLEQGAHPGRSRKVSGDADGLRPGGSEIGVTAMLHGGELSERGFTVDQVVHDYGDLCQAITDLAFEVQVPIKVDEFRTLNRCLDNGIADAVAEFSRRRESRVAENCLHATNERLGQVSHEMRNFVQAATLAVTAMRAGNVGLSGATAAILDRSLAGLGSLIDTALAEVRTTAGLPPRHRLVSVAHVMTEIASSASLGARARECVFTVAGVDPMLAVDVDPDMLFSALSNLLQNAFKFTRHGSEVSLRATTAADRVLIEVADHCGGLPAGAQETMFQPFVQHGADRSGVGLGLSIARRAIEANHGTLSVREVPGTGCVFTIDLPRQSMPAASASGSSAE